LPQEFAGEVDYDLMVNWDKRLARELPFFLDLFRSQGARRVIDVACGTGRHAAAFAARGFDVVGADVSETMIARARDNFPDAGVDFRLVDMTRLPETFGPASFDACVCLGNAFPCLETADQIDRALSGFAHLLKPAGLLVIHMLNFTHLITGRTFRGPHPGSDPNRDALFLKIFDPVDDRHEGGRIRVSVFQLERTHNWTVRVREGSLTPILPDQLTAALHRARFTNITPYADHTKSPFNPKESDSLVMVARKSEG